MYPPNNEPVDMSNNNNADGDNMYLPSIEPVDMSNTNNNADGEQTYQLDIVPVDVTTNNIADGENMYQSDMVPVDMIINNNNVDGDSNAYQPNMVPVDMINNNNNVDGDNNLYQPNMVPVDMTNNNSNADGDRNNNADRENNGNNINVNEENNENNNHADGDNNAINNANGGNNYNNNVNGAFTRGDEEFDSARTSENQDVGSGSEQDRPSKKKRYHRHTQYQIQEMEAFFKECPHPDDKQRKELSRQLGISHLQIKFWFQNKRTQNKNHQERHENAQLRTENDKLRAENYRYREAIFNAKCPKCLVNPTAVGEMSFEEHHLRLENSRLREEIQLLTGRSGNFISKQAMSYPMMSAPTPPQPLEVEMGANGRDVYPGGGNNARPFITELTDADKPMILELAAGAVDELMMVAQTEALWMGGFNGTSQALNLDEYNTRTIQRGPRLNGFRTEGSRDTAVVFMNHMDLVKMLMSAEKWSMVFAGLVSRASTHEVFTTGVANGDIQLMSAEYQVLSPLVPTRQSYFLRHCKQQGQGLWAVVDVSMDQVVPNMSWRRPSGCLIQELPNGHSKVIWVEHVEVEDNTVEIHYLYKRLLGTGQALNANRWMSTLHRQCERLASVMALAFPSLEPGGPLMISDDAKKRMLRLGDRMTRAFLTGVTTSNAHRWYQFHGGSGNDIRVMTSKSLCDPGRPPGIVLCAATAFWVPVSPKTIFDFLRNENTRAKWDVLSSGAPVQKVTEIANGRAIGNCVTLLKSTNFNNDKMLMVQESSTDPTASYVIFAPVDETAIEVVLSGGDSDLVALLPSGFVIIPDGSGQLGGEGGGSLVTTSFQMLVDTAPSGQLSMSCVATVENLIRATVERTRTLFPCQLD